MVRFQLLVLALFAACSCGKKSPPRPAAKVEAAKKTEVPSATDAGDDRAWVSYSGDGKTVLRQDPVGDKCHAECTTGEGKRVWEGVAPCLGVSHERRFVTADCERVVVLNPAPSREDVWSATEVMRVYTRNQLHHSVSGSSVIAEMHVGPSRSWLKGSVGVPGQEARYSSDGRSIELETVDGRSRSISLVREPTAVAEAAVTTQSSVTTQVTTATHAKVTAASRAISGPKRHRRGKKHQ